MNAGKKSRVFVVQEHHAKHLHHDLRLEMEGVLKSWAVPKGVPLEPGIKRLAVATEDHPLEYADFQGVIPEGMYGAGVVKIWDKGTYTAEKVSEKELVFNLRGEKLRGTYVLIRLKDGKNWLLFKKKTQKNIKGHS
jgi:bifunctional non-homologous end joining protein LigD